MRNVRWAVKMSDWEDVYTLLRTEKELLAFAKDGIYVVGDKGLTLKTAFDFKAPDYGIIARRQMDGRLVLADSHSLYEYDGSEVRELASGFNLIKDVFIDRWDRLWVATYEGLYCFFNRGFTNHRLTDGDDIVRAIGVDGEGQLVMGTLNGKVIVGGDIFEDNPDNYYVPNAVTIDGSVYMAGKDDVVCFDGTLHRLHLPGDRYQFVGKAGGRLIVGSRKCIAAYDPKTGSLDTLSTDIPYPWCAAEDAQGRLWVGTTFCLYVDGRKADYPQKLIVTTMERDIQGNIIFASADSLFIIGSENRPLTQQHELDDSTVTVSHWDEKDGSGDGSLTHFFVNPLDDSVAYSREFGQLANPNPEILPYLRSCQAGHQTYLFIRQYA